MCGTWPRPERPSGVLPARQLVEASRDLVVAELRAPVDGALEIDRAHQMTIRLALLDLGDDLDGETLPFGLPREDAHLEPVEVRGVLAGICEARAAWVVRRPGGVVTPAGSGAKHRTWDCAKYDIGQQGRGYINAAP